jgi:uncharacterized protein YgiM (DUF1202 family)
MAQNGDYELVCNSNNVNLRNNPGLSSSVIGTVNAGDVVYVSGQTVSRDGYGWIPVFVQRTGLSGYVADEFFEWPDGGTGWFRGTPVHVTSDNVNFRAGPGIVHNVLGTYDTGTNAIVRDGPTRGDGYNWYKLDIDGIFGWMAADFLAEGSSGEPSPGPGPGNGQFQIGDYVRPLDSLNLRSGPGTNKSVIGVYGPSNAATVIDGPQTVGMYAWYQVEMWDDGAVGWFANAYLELARFEPTGERLRVVDGPLNVRKDPGLSGSVITTLETGEVAVIADASFVSVDGYLWMNVYVENDPSLRGWIAQGFTKAI